MVMFNRRGILAATAALGATIAVLHRGDGWAASQPQFGEGKPDEDTGVTSKVAQFCFDAQFKDLPPELIETGKIHILDAIGLAIAGERAETGGIIRRYLDDLGAASGPSTIMGTSLKAQPRFAAFANGVAIHADDFDDTQLAVAKDRVYGLLTHPTVTAMPAALAVSEALGKSGRDFMLAYHLGVEIETKVAEAISPRSYESGFHSTSMCGVFGSAVSAAKLRGLDQKAIRQALGLAAAQASGLRENFGTMTKPFQAGHGAEAGVAAVDLVALGWTAADNILEAKRGFFSAFGDGWDRASIAGKLGKPWSLLSPGVSIKPYPSGSLTHPAMDVIARMREVHGINAADVANIRVGTNKKMLNTLIHHRPKTGLQAKFSMEFCVAALLVLGKAGLNEFQDEIVIRPDLQDMLSRVEFYNNPAADTAGLDKMRTFVEVTLKDGRTYSGAGDFARGSPEKPMSFDEVTIKFLECADYAKLPRASAVATIAKVRELEKIGGMRSLFDGLFG
jgi:2-methylcitrate dehydratase PrpD